MCTCDDGTGASEEHGACQRQWCYLPAKLVALYAWANLVLVQLLTDNRFAVESRDLRRIGNISDV